MYTMQNFFKPYNLLRNHSFALGHQRSSINPTIYSKGEPCTDYIQLRLLL